MAGFYFGSFSHVFNQSSAHGNENAAYGVEFLTEYATYADLVTAANFSNASRGPCTALPVANELNATGVAGALNLTAANATDSNNATHTIVCLNAIENGTISYLWGAHTDQIAWDTNNVSASNVTGLPTFDESLFNLTGNANLTGSVINETGCNPFFTNATLVNATRCSFFAGANSTEFIPHGGFYAPNGTWINEDNASSPDPWYWEPGQDGYLPGDQVYQASIGFVGGIANMTYEVVVSIGGVTPIPQVFFVNTGTGANSTLTFVFDMSAAWTSAAPGPSLGELNATEGYFGPFSALVGTVSITVSQCYVDASGATVCPNSLAGTTFP